MADILALQPLNSILLKAAHKWNSLQWNGSSCSFTATGHFFFSFLSSTPLVVSVSWFTQNWIEFASQEKLWVLGPRHCNCPSERLASATHIYICPPATSLSTTQGSLASGVWNRTWCCERTFCCSTEIANAAVTPITQPLGFSGNVPGHERAVLPLCDVTCFTLDLLSLQWRQFNVVYWPPPPLPSACPCLCSQRTLVGFCPVLPVSVAKRNHCLVLLQLGESMGLIVPSAACGHVETRPLLTCRDCSLLAVHSALFVCLLCLERGCRGSADCHISFQTP